MKTEYDRRSAIGFIEPLYKISVALAVAPPCCLKEHKISKWKTNKNYGILMTLLVITGYVLSVIGRVHDCYPYFANATLVVTDALFGFVLTVANVISILIPLSYTRTNFVTFLNAFATVDDFLVRNGKNVEKKYKFLVVQLIFGHVVMLTLFVYDAYVWLTSVGMKQYRNYIFRDIQSYYSSVVIMMIYNLLLSLTCRFRSLNELLDNLCPFDLMDNVNVLCELKVRVTQLQPYRRVQQISQVYEVLITQIIYFNRVFGWQILFITATIVVGLLNTLDILIVYGVFKNNHGSLTFGNDLIILSIFWSVLHFIFGTIVAASCDSATKEAQRTAEICYKLLLSLPAMPEKSQDRALREQLYLLAQLSSQRCPGFSAAGFFRVDYSMLLALFGSVTSYVIVVIQFNK
ncbi:hypothetical protein ILUMI_12954 [Ignelater luminosus]|uniref:Gustatory receptor n=1 Tax=Ignelater luminosus TaxID=2038154 RepID=A0A8K0G6A5_IGNLU|nr:hypothetical protein ILUMI_12954 [Ignelater luminosus]